MKNTLGMIKFWKGFLGEEFQIPRHGKSGLASGGPENVGRSETKHGD